MEMEKDVISDLGTQKKLLTGCENPLFIRKEATEWLFEVELRKRVKVFPDRTHVLNSPDPLGRG